MRLRCRCLSLYLTLCFCGVSFAGTFTNVASHPDAAAQPTSTGRIIMTLRPFNGHLYSGFGDYDTNTGPVGIRPFDPATNSFGNRLLNSGTEAVYLYRPIGSKLYAPHIDPIAGESTGGYALGTAAGATETWSDRFAVTGLHMFDIATYTGSDLWLAGSAGNDATLWRSTDSGANWSIAQSQPPVSTSFSRYYGIGLHDGKIFVQQSGSGSISRVFDGSAWNDGPNLLPFGGHMWQPGNFAGQLVYMSGEFSSALYGFDGAQAQIIHNPASGTGGGGATGQPKGIHDYAIADGYLFALGLDNIVRWTADLSSWHDIASAPVETRSLTVLDRQLFLGGTDSAIYRYSDPVVPEPSAALAAASIILLQVTRRRPRHL